MLELDVLEWEWLAVDWKDWRKLENSQEQFGAETDGHLILTI